MRLSHYLGIADHSVEPDPPIPGSRFRTAAADFARLLSRICSVVNSPPQTLQRQPGERLRDYMALGADRRALLSPVRYCSPDTVVES